MRLLDRYALREFTAPFALGVAGLCVVLLASIIFDLTELMVARQMPIGVVARLLLLKLPLVVALTLPMSALFAALFALGRLARDGELTVMRTAGCSFFRLVFPVIVAAALVCLLTFLLNELVVPEANHRAENLYRQAVFRDALPQVEEQVFMRGPEGRTFYVGEVDRRTRQMRHIMIFEPADGGAAPYPALLTAKEGTYSDGRWQLRNGVRRSFDADGYVTEEVAFESLEIPMVQGEEELFGEQRTTSEMSRTELGRLIKLYRKSGVRLHRFEVDYHMKVSLPLAALVWVLFAVPLVARAAKSGRSYGVVVSLAVAFTYYVAAAVCSSLGGSAILPPLVAAWLPTALYGAAGIWTMARADQV